MQKRLSFLGSMTLTGVLLVVLIVVLALATFVESAYNTPTAWALVYGTHWFEALLFLIGLNIFFVMRRHRFFNRRKIVVLLFHLAFLLILFGAAITRFISYGGNMHIREGDISNTMLSNNAYIDVTLERNGEEVHRSKEVMLTALTPGDYRERLKLGDERIRLRSTAYLQNLAERYVEVPDGEPVLQLVFVAEKQSLVELNNGMRTTVFGMPVSLNSSDSTAMLQFRTEGDSVFMYAAFEMASMSMGGGTSHQYAAGEKIPLRETELYTAGRLRFALQHFLPSARTELVEVPAEEMAGSITAVRLELSYRGMHKEILLPGMPRVAGQALTGEMGDLHYTLRYGSRELELPFSLFLKDFIVERYPGSNSPSSFTSEVVLVDPEMGIEEDRRIFMNNVLKHRGYRFYQSSYDDDEMGTILSVNKDRAGTFVTYLGYFLLIAGMLAALFVPGTRFARIARLSPATSQRVLLGLILLGGAPVLQAQSVPPREEARAFGELWVQDKGGRFKPMNTLSHELVRKVSKQAKYANYSADQVLLGMLMYPDYWKAQPLFEVKHPALHELIGFKGKRVSFNDLIDEEGQSYLLSELVNEAYSKPVVAQSDLDKEVIKLDDRVNALFLLQSGSLLKIFPDPQAENHRWASLAEALHGEVLANGDSLSMAFLHYLDRLRNADYAGAGLLLDQLAALQLAQTPILPADGRRRLEIRYNQLRVFPRLGIAYGILGFLLLLLQFMRIFRPGPFVPRFFRVGVILLAAGFVVHSLALAGRWYISGHPPMSNGYESMIFVAWVTILAGFIFVKRSGYAMALTAILAFLSLMVAGMSNMNPEITNLVPVLKSVWLTIHVAVIMAGYGFLGLASVMGLLNVSLYALVNQKNTARLKEVISEVTLVNQMTLIVGLYFMTAGVFLGGVWANESWGRYWGWDPKETWALITVLVYAFVAHMHRIPGMRGYFAYNLASFFAYASVLMTYFGVNYFLGGIHSYASGVAFKIPLLVYLAIVLLIALSVLAYRKQQRLLPGPSGEELPEQGDQG
ncbi:MAG: cytochrome C biogenesis protein [Bacteroidetes bacterium]|nr:MAG: cytochrome C biogenesis protein [Bacteroidota bacterium]